MGGVGGVGVIPRCAYVENEQITMFVFPDSSCCRPKVRSNGISGLTTLFGAYLGIYPRYPSTYIVCRYIEAQAGYVTRQIAA